MNDKKKFPGGLKVLLLLLFIMLFATCSNSYASISDEYLIYALNNLKDYNNFSETNKVFFNTLINSALNNLNNIKDVINTVESQYNLKNLTDVNYSFFIQDNGSYSSTILIIIHNASAPNNNNLNFIRLSNYIYANNNDGTSIYRIKIRYTHGSNELEVYNDGPLNYDSGQSYIRQVNIINSTFDVLTFAPASFSKLPAGYYNYNLTSSGTVYPVIFRGMNGNFTSSNSSSGDSGGDTSGEASGEMSGDSSGEIIGSVDLTKIENGIDNINQNLNNIENKIPTSGDMQSILSGETSKITNTLTNYNEDTGENGVNSIANNISNTMSGELSNNEIFSALDTAEQGFFDIISRKWWRFFYFLE